MAEYDFQRIESGWQKKWDEQQIYKVEIDHSRPKYYVLDMFPYPSGAGLHVGHPLGYIASDIYARFKRLKGFNVLHPMGFDAFGLPAEQYALQTGQHPAVTTDRNIKRYKEQLSKIGFGYDWNREVRTCNPDYYKWTQWTFVQMFNHYFDLTSRKAELISELILHFEQKGSKDVHAAGTEELDFSAAEWNAWDEKKKNEVLMNYRLAYQAETTVNWCTELGTVLANDEVRDGFSVRGGHPVIQKPMKQWLLRVSAYAERLLNGLEELNWSDSLKEMQRNWIGRSEGALIEFQIGNSTKGAGLDSAKYEVNKAENEIIEVFTTRPDTIFGSTFMVLAPEHPLVPEITTEEFRKAVEQYVVISSRKTERDRLAETKKISGQFTGAYVLHPFTGEKMPVWIADYVLWGYGTGAIMAVPAHDSRDYAFARHFNLPVLEGVSGGNIEMESYDAKEGKMINSGFLNGLEVKKAIEKAIKKIGEKGIGCGKVNYRMRDAIFSRQRYWGEPFPVFYKEGVAYSFKEEDLPLVLPEIDHFEPAKSGEAPLARVKNWTTADGYPIETDTMPGFAGSSAYYLRYMDPHNRDAYFSREANDYWKDVDLYIGGTEHATGHLIYARFWNKFLYDLGLSCREEPFKKLVNQGMIQGRSNFVYRVNPEKYAEYILWNEIKDRKLGVEFLHNYKEGHRSFDIYSKEAKLIIEIKQIRKLEKLESAYEDYALSVGCKILLIPVYKVLYELEDVITRLKEMLQSGKEITFLDDEPKQIKTSFVSAGIKDRELFSSSMYVDISLVKEDVLDIEAFKRWRPEFEKADFILEDGKYKCGWAIEKMSKSMHNVVNPDDIIEKYGADTFRMYEMFLGPIELHKPWNTEGIEGVSKFIKRFWNLFFREGQFCLNDSLPDENELKVLHKLIKKVEEDITKLSFNTSVSAFMIAVNDLIRLNCNKRGVLEPMIIVISPFAPHIAEELWHLSGKVTSVVDAKFPEFRPEYIKEDSFEYPVSINGKTRAKHVFPLDAGREMVEKEILEDENVKKWIESAEVRKVVFVPHKIINIVIGNK